MIEHELTLPRTHLEKQNPAVFHSGAHQGLGMRLSSPSDYNVCQRSHYIRSTYLGEPWDEAKK